MDVKITLDEKAIPGEWYNIVPDLPFDLPPSTSPRTVYPIGPHDLEYLFPQAIIEQELDTKRRSVKIPDAVRETYRLWRPTPCSERNGSRRCWAHWLTSQLGSDQTPHTADAEPELDRRIG
jgi:predicted alternative tryptophan synthase beta-subunit